MSPRFLWQSDSPARNGHTVSREGKQKSAELAGGSATDTASKPNQRDHTLSEIPPPHSEPPYTPARGPFLAPSAKPNPLPSPSQALPSPSHRVLLQTHVPRTLKPTPTQNHHPPPPKLSKLHQEQAGTYDQLTYNALCLILL